MAVDMLPKVTSQPHERDPQWKYDRLSFYKTTRIIDNLMQLCEPEWGISFNRTYSVKPYTRGTGLLHWLASCPRHDLRYRAVEYADKLTKDGRVGFSNLNDWHPKVSVNEQLSPNDLRFRPFFDEDSANQARALSATTPLHAAVLYNNLDMIKLLLRRGADPEKVDGSGLTPYGLYRQLYPDYYYFDEVEGGTPVSLEEGIVPEYFDWYNAKDAKKAWVAGLQEHMAYLR
jgi:hypothetical protein